MLSNGRPRNAAATRDAILQAATRRFSAEGYDDVGVRDIAADVGVDPALVVRYFGSKEDLFAAVLDSCDGEDLLEGPRETFGARLAHDLVYGGNSCDEDLRRLQIMLRSVSSSKAQEIVRREAERNFYGPFKEWIGGEHAAVRARLAAALMMGMEVNREVTGALRQTPEECKELERRLAGMLQAVIDD